MFRVTVLPALHGDAIWVEWGDAKAPSVAIFDSGPPKSTHALERKLERLQKQGRRVRLLVISHIDTDHIGGIVELLDAGLGIGLFDEIWFNGRSHMLREVRERFGVTEGVALQRRLDGLDSWNRAFRRGPILVPDDGALPFANLDGLEVSVLSPSGPKLWALADEWDSHVAADAESENADGGLPDPKLERQPEVQAVGRERFGGAPAPWAATAGDRSIPNGSSIALHLRYEGKCVVLTGDAHPSIVVSSLGRLPTPPSGRYDLVQLPHHGSAANVTARFLSATPAWNYFVSSDGSKNMHPDVRSLARMSVNSACSGSSIWFNYDGIDHIDSWFSTSNHGTLKRAGHVDADGVAIDLS